ncbi:MAG: hypothetical protein ACLP50_23200 [Solirubrobacteraceae bacterium]
MTATPEGVPSVAVAAYMVQFGGERFHSSGHINVLGPVALIVFVACVGVIFLPLTGLAVSGFRGALRCRRDRRRRLRAAATSELRARALMSELCPHGWRAQITVLHGAPDPSSDPSHEVTAGPERVVLDWTELEDESGRPAVMRRVCAPTIGAALEAMVADRRTDETLEQIERRAVADGALWPDL